MKSWNPRQSLEVIVLAGFVLFVAAGVALADERPRIVIGQDVESFEDYVRTFSHRPDGFMAYTSLQELEGVWSEADHGGGHQYAQKLIDEFPGLSMQLGLYLVDILDGIPQGRFDGQLTRLAKWFKEIRIPVYLRIGYEFDGPHNHYDPKEYVAAYRYIVDFLRRENVVNVLYVWHSFAGYVEGDVMRWYPGPEYVDWVGISFYDAYSAGFRNKIAKIADEINRPLMIAEAAPYKIGVTQGEKSWKMWFEKYFQFIQEHHVRLFSYINWDWNRYWLFKDQGWGNSRLQDDPYIFQKWVEELKKNGYIPNALP